MFHLYHSIYFIRQLWNHGLAWFANGWVIIQNNKCNYGSMSLSQLNHINKRGPQKLGRELHVLPSIPIDIPLWQSIDQTRKDSFSKQREEKIDRYTTFIKKTSLTQKQGVVVKIKVLSFPISIIKTRRSQLRTLCNVLCNVMCYSKGVKKGVHFTRVFKM